jgi:2-dehydropantoate 2-reductase
MKIAVLGAGAVGCYFGGMLARAGHDVVLIGRPRHVEAVQARGLMLETRAGREAIAVASSVDAAAVAGAHLVLFCVKSTDTEVAGAQIASRLAPDARVLCLQNGVDNAARLQPLLPCAVAPAAVYVAAEMAGPGHVRHHGRGDLVIGPLPGAAELVRVFGEAGIPVQVSADVGGALWAKLIINCAYNALSAITRLPYGRLVQGEGIEAVIGSVVQECLAVAERDGVTVPGDIGAEVQAIARTMATQISSTAFDVARGRRSEIDHLNGYVARRGQALGIATPVNGALHAIVKLLETSPPALRQPSP